MCGNSQPQGTVGLTLGFSPAERIIYRPHEQFRIAGSAVKVGRQGRRGSGCPHRETEQAHYAVDDH